MTDLKIGPEYGEKFQGTYKVRPVSWKELRELVRTVGKTNDKLQYAEDLLILSVTGPVPITKETIGDMPAGLLMRLIEEASRLNDVGRQEAGFLQS